MKQEFYDKLYDLSLRAREFGETNVKCDVELEDDYFHITELHLTDNTVTVTHADGDFRDDFPISAFSESIIEDILYDAECTIEQEEEDFEKVKDNNFYASL